MRIVLDVTGGDNAPDINLEGAIEALGMFPDVEIILAGEKDAIEAALAQKYAAQLADGKRERLSVVDAPEVITPEEHPVMALRKKKNSPFCVGMDLVRKKEAEAFVSAGSTGAVMAGSMFKIGRIKGISRPALAAVVPVPGRPLLLIDAGANVDCKPEYLQQFAIMGDAYMRCVRGLKNPRVGLLNIGAEAEKGTTVIKKAYELLAESELNFTGNVEARDIPYGKCDVIVADGFTGNIILKLTEGLAAKIIKTLGPSVPQEAMAAVYGKLDYSTYGGAPILGINKPVIKIHGSSGPKAVKRAIIKAADFVSADIVGMIRSQIK